MKIIACIVAFLAFGTADAAAQISQEEIAIIQNLYGMEKRTIYMKVMDLSPGDSVSFWPLYNEYEDDRKDLGTRRIKNMERFTGKYPAISAEELDEIAEEAIDIAEGFLEIQEDYYEKMKEATSTMTAAKFLQLESFLNSVIQSELAVRMPFIGEFHEVKPAKK